MHSLGLQAGGSLWAWGWNALGQLGLNTTDDVFHAPTRVSANNWVALAAGYNHNLGLQANGSLWAWGWNYYGQLGLNDTTDRLVPTRVGSANNWVAVAAGVIHSLSLHDGFFSFYAWGNNSYTQLGTGDTINRLVPTLVGTGGVALSAGGYHNLGLKVDGSLWAWGDNGFGQLGLNDTSNRPSLTLVRRFNAPRTAVIPLF